MLKTYNLLSPVCSRRKTCFYIWNFARFFAISLWNDVRNLQRECVGKVSNFVSFSRQSPDLPVISLPPGRRYRVRREMSQFGLLPSLLHCCRSGFEWIRIHLAILNPDPYWEWGSGSGSRSMKIGQNFQINLASCLSKRLLYLRSYVFLPNTYL